jgi:uncharacterized protein YndB with AHSA1/START domain
MEDVRPKMHWPAGFTPERADCFCHAEAVVAAPVDHVFGLLADVERWPDWVPDVTAVNGMLGQQCTFEVHLRGERFEVLVAEHQAPHRIGWTAIADELQIYQAWLFAPDLAGTRVTTEVVAVGPAAAAYRESRPSWADGITRGWLRTLAV